jgi:hypothetical protein
MKVQSRTTYKCEYCEKRSTVKSKMQRHEKECMARIKKSRSVNSEAKEIRNNAKSVSHLGELCSKFLSKNLGIKCDVVFKNFCGDGFGEPQNTHSAPIGKKSNFSKKSHLPLSYVGWSGTCEIHVDGGYNPSVSELFRRIVGVHTGTGGARDFGFSWGCTLWADDFRLFGNKIYNLLDAQKGSNVYYLEQENIDVEYKHLITEIVESSKPVKILQEKINHLSEQLHNEKAKSKVEAMNKNEKPKPSCKRVTKNDLKKIVDEIK